MPFYCGTCKVFHERKTYHLDLDDTGSCIVSETVLNRLKELRMAGFEIVNEVKKPPTITLKMPKGIESRFRIYEGGAEQHGKTSRPIKTR